MINPHSPALAAIAPNCPPENEERRELMSPNACLMAFFISSQLARILVIGGLQSLRCFSFLKHGLKRPNHAYGDKDSGGLG